MILDENNTTLQNLCSRLYMKPQLCGYMFDTNLVIITPIIQRIVGSTTVIRGLEFHANNKLDWVFLWDTTQYFGSPPDRLNHSESSHTPNKT